MAAILANGDGLCVDLNDYFDVPIKLFNVSRGIGLKLGTPSESTSYI